MGLQEIIKGRKPEPAPVVEAKAPPVVAGGEVDLGDAGARVYKDKSGGKLGGGPTEGASYRDTVAEGARASVVDHELRELAALEKELAKS